METLSAKTVIIIAGENSVALSNDEIKKIAVEVVKQFFAYIDINIGSSIRKKLIWVMVAMIIVGAISLGIIKLPGGGV